MTEAIQFGNAQSPSSFAWGFLQITGFADAPASYARLYREGDDVAGVSIFGDGADAAQNTSLIYIKMYRLPAADAVFAGDLKSFGENAKPIDPATLAPKGLPAHWRHKAVAADSGLVHAWRGGSRALLVRYVLQQGDKAAFPLFRWAVPNVRVAGTWLFDPPQLSPEEEPLELGTTDRPLDDTERAQVAANAKRTADQMRLSPMAKPAEVVKAIRDQVDQWRPWFAQQKPNVQHNYSVCVGSLWGEALCNVTGWEWCSLMRDGDGPDDGFLAIVSPDRAFALAPVDVILNNLHQPADDDGGDNNVLLLFNMIRAGQLPQSNPRRYHTLS